MIVGYSCLVCQCCIQFILTQTDEIVYILAPSDLTSFFSYACISAWLTNRIMNLRSSTFPRLSRRVLLWSDFLCSKICAVLLYVLWSLLCCSTFASSSESVRLIRWRCAVHYSILDKQQAQSEDVSRHSMWIVYDVGADHLQHQREFLWHSCSLPGCKEFSPYQASSWQRF